MSLYILDTDHLTLIQRSDVKVSLRFLAAVPLEFTTDAASIYERLRQTFRHAGKMDLQIAATALAVDATLVTRNLRDFNFITNLRLDNWA